MLKIELVVGRKTRQISPSDFLFHLHANHRMWKSFMTTYFDNYENYFHLDKKDPNSVWYMPNHSTLDRTIDIATNYIRWNFFSCLSYLSSFVRTIRIILRSAMVISMNRCSILLKCKFISDYLLTQLARFALPSLSR